MQLLYCCTHCFGKPLFEVFKHDLVVNKARSRHCHNSSTTLAHQAAAAALKGAAAAALCCVGGCVLQCA
jgi:hypothetical protein